MLSRAIGPGATFVVIGRYGAAAHQIATLFDSGGVGTLTDGQLLERFSGRPGEPAEAAFASLVARHGPLVLRVCRSILREEQDALDAFQATFLVLVHKAGSLRVGETLAPWLQSVAYRVALCARGSAARRRRHELRAAERSGADPIGPRAEDSRELGRVLHEEIGRLPDRYRVPIVLCDLEGRSHDEAARHLGWPVGTVKSRQARGRDRLRSRLTLRGLAPSAGLAALSAGVAEAAPVSPGLIRSTVAPITAKGALASSSPAAILAKEVLMGYAIGKLKWAAASLLVLTVMSLGIMGAASRVSGKARPAPRARKTVVVQAEVPRDRAGKIYFGHDDGLIAVDPKTGESSRILLQCKGRPRISPDGRLIAFEWDNAVWVRELERIVEPRKLLDLEGATAASPPVWSHDGSKLIISLGRDSKPHDHWRFTTFRINADGSGREELKQIPTEDGVQDWSADDWLVTTSSRNAKIGWELYIMKPDGSGQRQITDGGNPFYTRFSPDGKRILYNDGTTEERRGVWVVDLDGQHRRKILYTGKDHASACWSPDGKKIAVLVFPRPDQGPPPRGRLVIVEVDGDNKAEFPLDEEIKNTDMPDWR